MGALADFLAKQFPKAAPKPVTPSPAPSPDTDPPYFQHDSASKTKMTIDEEKAKKFEKAYKDTI